MLSAVHIRAGFVIVAGASGVQCMLSYAYLANTCCSPVTFCAALPLTTIRVFDAKALPPLLADPFELAVSSIAELQRAGVFDGGINRLRARRTITTICMISASNWFLKRRVLLLVEAILRGLQKRSCRSCQKYPRQRIPWQEAAQHS